MKALRCIGILDHEIQPRNFSLGCIYIIYQEIKRSEDTIYYIFDDDKKLYSTFLNGYFYKFELVEV